MAIILRRPDVKHDNQVQAMSRFLSREVGDMGTLKGLDFEVVRVETLKLPSAQTERRLVCRYMESGDEFNIDSHQVQGLKVDWE